MSLRRSSIAIGLVALVAAPASGLTITAERLLEVETGKILSRQVIQVDNGRIVSITPRGAGQSVDVDLGDATILPGLLDAHVHLTGGEEQTPYDALVLATGSVPFVPPVEGATGPGRYVYRTIEDLEAIKAAAATARRGVVVGGGLLVIPGFVSAAMGLLLYLPPVRSIIRGYTSKRVQAATATGRWAYGTVRDVTFREVRPDDVDRSPGGPADRSGPTTPPEIENL